MLGQVLSENDWKHARDRGRTAFVATRVFLGAGLVALLGIGVAIWFAIEKKAPDVGMAFLLGAPALTAAIAWLQARTLWDRCLANYPADDHG